MITHAEAEAKFKRCRNKERGYKLANNTRLQKRGHAFAVRLHETDVVMIRPNGTYRLNTGGWRTATTKDRMNMVLPYCIWQRNGIWYAGDAHYTDGMLIGPDGQAIDAKTFTDIEKIKVKVDRQVNQFIKLVTQACARHDIGTWESYGKRTVPRPSNKTHLKNLWTAIHTALDSLLEIGSGRPDWSGDLNTSAKLIHLATLARDYSDPRFIWGFIRSGYLYSNKSGHALQNLRAFMRPRKPIIAQMIAEEELV